jgi:hypothetical protein
MNVKSARKRKYEVLAENEETDELPTVRDTIMDNSTHGDSALNDNDEYEPREQQPSLDDVPQLTTQAQTCHHTVDEEDANMTSCPHKMSLEAEHSPQITTQPPEAPEVSNTEENRSLEEKNETTQNTSDDKEKMNVGRNDEEEFAPNDNKPPGDDDKAAERAVDKPYTKPGDEPTMQHGKRMHVTPIDVAASKDHDTRKVDYEPREELNEGIDNAKKHDEERTPEPMSPSTPMSQDHYSSHSNSVCSYPDISSMETTSSPRGRNHDHVYTSTPHGSTNALWNKDDHLKEMLVTQMDLLQQQAIMDKRQIREEIFNMKNRIKWLEDRAMKQQVGPTELAKETLSTPTSSRGHQRVFLQLPANNNNTKFPSLHPVPSQQTVWEIWNRSRHEQLHPTSVSVPDDSEHDPYAHEDTHEDERWDQLHRDYNDSHDNEDSDEINTPEMSDEDDLASILDLPPAKPKRGDIMDDDNEAADIMTKIDMTGDHIVLHEEVTTVNVNKVDIFVKKEMLAHDTNLHDGKNEIIQVARCDNPHRDQYREHRNYEGRTPYQRGPHREGSASSRQQGAGQV